ncbi:hypothetical protein ACGFI9_01470 [Micromonospora sp. NPDC048930]|uniref:hypothetical protein n=1 Tax=Micromonospora sp. NPDC048930 TaxID=3364261 RepID=UPI00370FDEF2
MEKTTDPAQVQHPVWCIKGTLCTQDGIHHSRPLTANSGDAHDSIRLWLERAWSLTDPSLVLESTVDGEVSYTYMPLAQGRVLRHQLGRLLDLSKDGQR